MGFQYMDNGINWRGQVLDAKGINFQSKYTVDIPEGVSGDYSIIHCHNLNYEDWPGIFPNYVLAKKEFPEIEKYTLLVKQGYSYPFMQDSYAEFEEHQWLWDNASGDVLIGGLGIGMVNEALILKDEVTSVTILEKEQDVIDLVWEHCAKDDRFTLIHTDAETWEIPEGSNWDTIFLDCWTFDNTTHHSNWKTHMDSKYSPYTNKLGYYGFWRGLDNYYEINKETGILENRVPNIARPWF
jgi:hypothetical protein